MGAIATQPPGAVGNILGPGEWDDRSVLVADGDDSNKIVGTGVLIDSSDNITGVASIEVDEDGWIGIGATAERFTFNGTSNEIRVNGCDYMLFPLTTQARFRDAALYIASDSDSILALHADGYVRVGSSTPTNTLGANSLLVSDRLEVVDYSFFLEQVIVEEGVQFRDDSTSCATLDVNSTLLHAILGLSTNVGRTFILGQSSYIARNHDHATQTNPTLFIHSATDPDSDNTQWISFYHDQTDGNIDVGTGNLNLNATITLSGNITMPEDGWIGIGAAAERISFNGTAGILLVSDSHFRMAGGNQFQCRDADLYIASDADSILALHADGYVRIGSGTSSQGLGADGDFLVSGKLEVDGEYYLDIGARGSVSSYDAVASALMSFFPTAANSGRVINVFRNDSVATIAFKISIGGGGNDTVFDTTNGDYFFQKSGVELVHLDGAGGTTVFNETGADIDFRIEGDTDANLFFVDAGTDGVGIGTATVPHGGIGAAKLAIEGANASNNGPHIQLTTVSDDYPLMQIL
jgi:hypothetical protein